MRQASTPFEGSLAAYPVHPFHILEQNSVASFFEPVVSVQKMGVIGLETLSRAVHPDNQSLIEPQDLFRGMGDREPGLKLALDRLFRKKGLEDFSPFQNQAPNLLLFLGIEPSILEEAIVGSGHLLRQVRELSLDPQQVVVQISLAGEMNPLYVKKFIDLQRSHHFLVALTGVKNRPDHLDMMLRFNPDLVRFEEPLTRGLAAQPAKQEALRAVLKQAHALGILAMAHGVESEEDALMALEMGVDLLQGGYFSRSYKTGTVFTLGRKARMQFLASRYRRRAASRAKRDLQLKSRCGWLADSIFSRFTPPVPDMEGALRRQLGLYPALECLYLLDSEGTQITSTVCSQTHIPLRKQVLFQPSPKGTDHSHREYFYALAAGENRHLTEPAISMNSGNLCVTVSQSLEDGLGGFHILCLDLNLSKV
ncbi:MAG TPA: EAL domain-containing protein [bacterium]|nr:EAL domain-containing protein [bacterium]